jgi:hypothetical protein
MRVPRHDDVGCNAGRAASRAHCGSPATPALHVKPRRSSTWVRGFTHNGNEEKHLLYLCLHHELCVSSLIEEHRQSDCVMTRV